MGRSKVHTAIDIEVPANARNPSYHRGKTFAKTGMHITIEDLTYSVPDMRNKKERAFLLKDVSGAFYPGQMSALMGPSGSGKTTLLDVLAGRKTTGKTEGSILFACNKASPQFLRRYTGYVEQFDTLLPILTVEEMLMYTAELKRPISESLEEKREAVETVLEKLALTACKDVKIGNALNKGISGGQAKRTNIGISLITNPRVLFLDEPTSGLDSFTANEVMTVVRALVKDNVAIVATIHSPTQYCFSLFDSLMMLLKGSVVYFGGRSEATAYVKSLPCSDMIEEEGKYNDAEFLVDLFTKADRDGQAEQFVQAYRDSDLRKEAGEQLMVCSKEKHDLPEQVRKELAVKRATVTPSWWALKTLVKYRTLKNYKDPEFLGPRVMDKVLIGIIVMTCYLGIGNDFQPKNFINMSAVLFMWITLPAFGAAAYVPAIVLERALFTREKSDGLYRVSTYLAAKMVDEFCIAALGSIVVAAFVYYGIQLQGSFLLFWLVYYITLCTGIVLAYFVAAMSPNMDVANAALPTYVVTLLFFAGFLINFRDIPPWWIWYSYLNFMRYAWSALMVNQFQGRTERWIDGRTVLDNYKLADVSKWEMWGIQWAFLAFFTIAAWAALSFRKHSRR